MTNFSVFGVGAASKHFVVVVIVPQKQPDIVPVSPQTSSLPGVQKAAVEEDVSLPGLEGVPRVLVPGQGCVVST